MTGAVRQAPQPLLDVADAVIVQLGVKGQPEEHHFKPSQPTYVHTSELGPPESRPALSCGPRLLEISFHEI